MFRDLGERVVILFTELLTRYLLVSVWFFRFSACSYELENEVSIIFYRCVELSKHTSIKIIFHSNHQLNLIWLLANPYHLSEANKPYEAGH